MNKFQVGNRVECHYCDGSWDGELGTVVYVPEFGGGTIAVELDLYDEHKHNCDGKAKNGHGWYYRSSELTLIRDSMLLSLEDLI